MNIEKYNICCGNCGMIALVFVTPIEINGFKAGERLEYWCPYCQRHEVKVKGEFTKVISKGGKE